VSYEKTLRLVTDLDRAAIEEKLREVRNSAEAAGLAELGRMFLDIEGAPRARLERDVHNALAWLRERPEHGRLAALLELVEINLPNLK